MTVLDTQAWLWWLHDPTRLTNVARERIVLEEQHGHIVVSVISVWEIATKCALGKLTLPMQLDKWFAFARSYPAIIIEPVSSEDAIKSTRLPGNFHKDPADRIIVALAMRLQSELVTSDSQIRAYPHITTVW